MGRRLVPAAVLCGVGNWTASDSIRSNLSHESTTQEPLTNKILRDPEQLAEVLATLRNLCFLGGNACETHVSEFLGSVCTGAVCCDLADIGTMIEAPM